MTPEMRRAKLAKLIELEGFGDENALFAAAMSDTVCPAFLNLNIALSCSAYSPSCGCAHCTVTLMRPDAGCGGLSIQAIPHFGFGEVHFHHEAACKGRKQSFG